MAMAGPQHLRGFVGKQRGYAYLLQGFHIAGPMAFFGDGQAQSLVHPAVVVYAESVLWLYAVVYPPPLRL